MSGQMRLFKEKQAFVDKFISHVNPYKKVEPLMFDLRGYAKYLKEHGIAGNSEEAKTVAKNFVKR